LGQGRAGECAGAAPDGAKQRPLRVIGQTGGLDVGVQVAFKIVVAGHLVPFAALLMQSHPQTAILHTEVFDLHAERGANAGKGIDHQPDQGAVAQARDGRDVDRVQQPSRFGGLQHGCLATPDLLRRAAHRDGRIDGVNLSRHQPVK
jgi:hypothetical protein